MKNGTGADVSSLVVLDQIGLGQGPQDAEELLLPARRLRLLQIDLGHLKAVGVDQRDRRGWRTQTSRARRRRARRAGRRGLSPDALGFLAIDFLEARVVDFLRQTVENQAALVERDGAVGVAVDQVEEVQAAQDGDLVLAC